MVSLETPLYIARAAHHHATLETTVDCMPHVPPQNGEISKFEIFLSNNFVLQFHSDYGQYECVCHPGYYGDGYNCIENITCRNTPSMCDPNGICMQTGQSFACVCNPGMYLCRKVLMKALNLG